MVTEQTWLVGVKGRSRPVRDGGAGARREDPAPACPPAEGLREAKTQHSGLRREVGPSLGALRVGLCCPLVEEAGRAG